MEIADTITGCLLLGIPFVAFTVMNYKILFMRIRKKEKIPSPAPIIGGLAGSILVMIFFRFEYPLLVVLPLIIDPGCIPLIIWFIVCMILDLTGKP